MRYMQLVACTYLEEGPRLNVQQCGSNSMCVVSTHQKLRSMITHVVCVLFRLGSLESALISKVNNVL